MLIGILWNRLEIDRSNINLDWVVGLTFECLVIIVVIGIDALAHLELAVGVTVNADRLLQATQGTRDLRRHIVIQPIRELTRLV